MVENLYAHFAAKSLEGTKLIEKLILKNYRNLRLEDGLKLDPLTIFVGANGSGKTNLIRVLRFMQDSWINPVDERRGVTRFESAVARWGSGRILDKTLEMPAVVNIGGSFRLQSGFIHDYLLGLDVKDDYGVFVRGEYMDRWPESGDEKKSFRYFFADIPYHQIAFAGTWDETKGDHKAQLVGSLPANELPVHSLPKWIEENSDIPLKDTPFFEGKRLMEDFISTWAFYDASQMNIEGIKKASSEVGLGDRTLTTSGDNLALVLYNLSQDINFQEKIVQLMTELFPQTRSLRANVVGRVSLTVEWHLHGIPKPIFLDEMSEGTVRMLCWMAILFSPKNPPRLLVLDEPEASLHPAWLKVLAGWIRDASRRTQIIVSTHSPDLLDYFTEEMSSVRVFDQDPTNPLFTCIRSIDPKSVEEKIAEGWQLGDLYRVGDPLIGGWPW